jgi:hypothetical protein
MARARNIKPGFFTNEEMVELDFATRLLFIGLWTMADRAGRMEDRPKKIKMSLFPADNLDIDECLNDLQRRGFIIRYSCEKNQYIQILNFTKHQNPHIKEPPSTIPAPDEHGASTVQAHLIPDSGFLIPDSGFAEDAAVVNQPSHTSTLTDEPPQTEHQKTGIFPMYAEWLVSKTFASLCKSSGISDALLTDDNLREFRTYWLTQPQKMRTQTEWEHALIKSIKSARLRGGTSPPSKISSRESGRTMAARSIGFGVDDKQLPQRIEKEVTGEKLE